MWEIKIDQGSFWEEALLWTDESGTPLEINAPVLMDIKTSKGVIVKSMGTSPRTGIVLGEDVGTLLFALTAAETLAMTPGFHKCDLFVHDSTNRRVKIHAGPVEVVGAVTTL